MSGGGGLVQLGGLEPPASCSTDIARASPVRRQSRLSYENHSIINEQARHLPPYPADEKAKARLQATDTLRAIADQYLRNAKQGWSPGLIRRWNATCWSMAWEVLHGRLSTKRSYATALPGAANMPPRLNTRFGCFRLAYAATLPCRASLYFGVCFSARCSPLIDARRLPRSA